MRWGQRTLAASERAYNPLGYHLGSIWPHDAAIGAAGLRRYGRMEAARRVIEGLMAAGEYVQWRLPELFGGLSDDLPHPVPYPVACSPQAWSAATPLLLLRTVPDLQPDVAPGFGGAATGGASAVAGAASREDDADADGD